MLVDTSWAEVGHCPSNCCGCWLLAAAMSELITCHCSPSTLLRPTLLQVQLHHQHIQSCSQTPYLLVRSIHWAFCCLYAWNMLSLVP